MVNIEKCFPRNENSTSSISSIFFYFFPFSFQQSNHVEVEEGSTLNLTVIRTYGSHGDNTIQWDCFGDSLDDDATPLSGSLTFAPVN